eukprot:scaffold55573_cov30-Tisochrysis_lutea.AAC.5
MPSLTVAASPTTSAPGTRTDANVESPGVTATLPGTSASVPAMLTALLSSSCVGAEVQRQHEASARGRAAAAAW